MFNSELWSFPKATGRRPPPCSRFTLTMMDDHHAVLFGGYLGRELRVVNHVYIIDMAKMVSCNSETSFMMRGYTPAS